MPEEKEKKDAHDPLRSDLEQHIRKVNKLLDDALKYGAKFDAMSNQLAQLESEVAEIKATRGGKPYA